MRFSLWSDKRKLMWQTIVRKIKKFLGIKTDEEIIQSYQKIAEQEEQIDPEEYQCKVLFAINNKGGIVLDIDWYKNDPIVAENLGNLLYAINSGFFENNCVNVVSNEGTKHPEKMQFVKRSLECYGDRKKGNVLIKPSQVFSVSYFHDQTNQPQQ